MTPGFDGEQFINHLLDRIENNARSADRAWRKRQELRAEFDRTKAALDISQEGNRRHYRDMKAVEAKIAEWSAYGAALRAAIDAITNPKKGRRPTFMKLPDEPGPLETEIPF